MKPLRATVVAGLLQDVYELRFGGKTRGRYSITREQMRELSGRKGRLETKVQLRIIDESRKLGLVVIPTESGFSVIESSKVNAWRPVSNQVIRKLIQDHEEEFPAEDDEDDDA